MICEQSMADTCGIGFEGSVLRPFERNADNKKSRSIFIGSFLSTSRNDT